MTELDQCILAVIWRQQPVTAYGVRSHFAGSPTPAWSSSTGSIYPAIKRLEALGLVQASAPGDGRGRRLLGLTARGEAALRDWLSTLQPGEGAPAADPIRTKAHFLDALSQGEARAFLDRAVAETQAATARLEAVVAGFADPGRLGERLGAVGGLYELRARLEWLSLVRRELEL